MASIRTLGKTIAELRHTAGLSQEDLATKADINSTYVSRIENDRKVPTVTVLIRIARALNVKPSRILDFLNDH